MVWPVLCTFPSFAWWAVLRPVIRRQNPCQKRAQHRVARRSLSSIQSAAMTRKETENGPQNETRNKTRKEKAITIWQLQG